MPTNLLAPPPIATPFLDTSGRITAPWVAWLNAITSAAATLSGASAGALLALNNLSDLGNIPTARVNLGLGSAATKDLTYFDLFGAAAAAVAGIPNASALVAGLLKTADWTTFNNKQSALAFGNFAEVTSAILTITGGAGAVIGSGLTVQVKQASSSQSGYLASSDWTTFNSKQAALTTGNLTEVTSAVLTITGGTGAVIGSGVTVQVKQASSSVSGFLTSTDWTTFNNKQAALTTGNFTEATSAVLTITGGTGAVIGSGLSVQVKQASGSQAGYLASADWTTFNAKQAALTLPLALGSGGTGQTTASAAYNALSPLTTLGDTVYGGASGAGTRLAGNTTGVRQFKAQTGTGTVSAAPVWTALSASDIPTLNQSTTGTAANVTGTVALANGGTGSTTAAAARTALGVPGLAGGNAFTGTQSVSSGSVGLGVASPQSILDVLGTSGAASTSFKGIVQIASNTNVGVAFGTNTASPYGSWLQSQDSRASNAGTYPLLLNPNGGNVGVGLVAPSYLFDVAGAARVTSLVMTAGSNTKTGSGTLAAGTVTIANTSVTANSKIFLQNTNTGALTNVGTLVVSAKTAATSFTVKSSNASDTSTFDYWIIEN